MPTPLEQASRMDLFLEGAGSGRIDPDKYEAKVARFERLGIRLFGVSNCLLSFGKLVERFDRSERSIVVLEANLCESLGFSEEIRVFNNLNFEHEYAEHPSVAGEPHIVFCAQHPIFDINNVCVASLYLIDYQERDFDDESRLLFADLAVMVERELAMGSLKLQHLEMQKQIRNLKRDALLDPVLGMWNRAAIMRSLGIELERCTKSEKPLSLLFIAVKQYQGIKDERGSVASDAFLLKVASRMRSCIRPFDALGRFEPDVFLVVLPGASHLVAAAVAERMRLALVSRPETIEDISFDIEMCVGFASSSIFPQTTTEHLVNQAEKALISARHMDSNAIVQAQLEQPDISI